MVALVPLSCLQDREFSSFAKTFWEKPKNHLGLSQNSKEFWNPHSIPRFTIDQSPHFSIDFFFVGAPAGLSSLNPLSRGPDISSDALNAVFGAHVIDLPILDCWTVRSVRSVTGLGKPGLTNEKKKGASGELLPPILCCKKYHTWENELRLGNQH